MKSIFKAFRILLPGLALPGLIGVGIAGYKARDWSAHSREQYAASLASEGVTIAAEPLFTDAQAARVFDKKDIVTRGIMPIAVVIFNDNDYPVEVQGASIELIRGEDRFRSLTPRDAVNHIFGKDRSISGGSIARVANEKALDDFAGKFLGDKVIAGHAKGGGFLYLKMYRADNLADYLSTATVYIPNVCRADDGSPLIYFEIELKAAVNAVTRE